MKKNIKVIGWRAPKILFMFFFSLLVFFFLVYAYISISPKVLGINIQEFANTRNTYKTVLKAKRGTIFDKDGNTLALNVYSYTVIAYLEPSRTVDMKNPKHVVDKEYTAKMLSPLLNMTESDLISLLSLDRYQVELGPGGRGITELKKEEIEKLNLPGIDFIESSKRFYPNGDFASYVIGYAKTNEKDIDGKKVNVIEGELGIESKYNDMLSGVDGMLSYQQDANGYQIPETKEERIDALDGYDVYLTINSSIQRFLEEAMNEAEAKYNYEWLQIHIMDVETGNIVASSKSPSFDPNTREIENYENNLTNVLIEPGSVMKTFTYLCAMEKGTYDGTKKFKSGSIVVEDTYVKDWNNSGWGTITYDFGYEKSSNVGITKMLLEDNFITAADLKECLTKYGFGANTNVEMNESAGKIDFYYPIEIASAGFGQGIYVTPIQILQAYSIIANNGKMVKPHVINKIVDNNENKIVYESEKEESETLVSSSSIKKIKELMYNVINSPTGSGSGYSLLKSDIVLIGKTGTAQIYENGGYLRNQYIRSFAGMFPYENPKYIVYAAVKKVTPDANTVLTTVVKKVVQNISKYYNMYDNANSSIIPTYTVSNYVNKSSEGVKNALKDLGLVPIIIGDGDYIVSQYPNKSTILKGEKIFLKTNGENITMPDMTKWSRADVINYFDILGFDYTINGNGYVKSQNIKAGNMITSSSNIVITLEDIY